MTRKLNPQKTIAQTAQQARSAKSSVEMMRGIAQQGIAMQQQQASQSMWASVAGLAPAQQQAVSPARIVATGLASWLPTAEDLAIDTSSWRVGDLFSYTNEYDREFDSRLCTLLIIDSDTEGNTAAKFGFDNARTHWAVTETMLSYYTRMTEDNNHDPQD